MGERLPLAIAGSLGRMGLAVDALARTRADVEIVGGFDRGPGASADRTAQHEALRSARVVIDFTSASASAALATVCAESGRPALVIGSTGWTDAEERELRRAAERLPIVRAGNFSLGVNLLAALVRRAARALPSDGYDIEVLEMHHRRKVDAPSGTALLLARAAAGGREVELDAVAERGRDGIAAPRAAGAIGFAVLRGGGMVGEHSVLFAAEDEVITLSHSARDRTLFARGAIEAALWVAGRSPGLYDMMDVLGLD